MADSFEDQPWVKLGVSAALEKEYLRDHQTFIRLLGETLQAAVPNDTEILTRGFLKKTVSGVAIAFEDNRYTLELSERGSVTATRSHIVRGIALKNEPLPVEQCLAEIAAHLEARAQESASARAALANLLGLR